MNNMVIQNFEKYVDLESQTYMFERFDIVIQTAVSYSFGIIEMA